MCGSFRLHVCVRIRVEVQRSEKTGVTQTQRASICAIINFSTDCLSYLRTMHKYGPTEFIYTHTHKDHCKITVTFIRFSASSVFALMASSFFLLFA